MTEQTIRSIAERTFDLTLKALDDADLEFPNIQAGRRLVPDPFSVRETGNDHA